MKTLSKIVQIITCSVGLSVGVYFGWKLHPPMTTYLLLALAVGIWLCWSQLRKVNAGLDDCINALRDIRDKD